jgi:hypothetical protein
MAQPTNWLLIFDHTYASETSKSSFCNFVTIETRERFFVTGFIEHFLQSGACGDDNTSFISYFEQSTRCPLLTLSGRGSPSS